MAEHFVWQNFTQKTFDSAFKELSNGIKQDKIRMKTRPQISIFVRPTRRVKIASNEMTLNGFKWFRSTIRPTWHCVDVINCGVNWLNGLVCENGDFWGGYWGAPLRRASTWIGGRQEEASPKIEMFGSWQELKRPPCGGLANSFAVFDFGAAFVSVFFQWKIVGRRRNIFTAFNERCPLDMRHDRLIT